MPVPILKKEAEKNHTSLQTQENRWQKAKRISEEEYGKDKWGAIMKIYEDMNK